MGGVNDIIIRNRISGRLMANVGLNRGLMSFYEDILIRKEGNVLDFISIPDDFAGKRFEELLSSFSVSGMGIALGLKKEDGELKVNPLGSIVCRGDMVLLLRDSKVSNT